MRRAALLWLVLFAAYASTLGTNAFGGVEYGPVVHGHVESLGNYPYGPAELRYLETAESIADHGALGPRRAHGIGFPILIAPAYAVGGAKGVELFCAALAALAFVLAAALARRLVPDPWATAGPLVVGLSLPALGYGAAVMPELTAGAALAGAALLALRVRDAPRNSTAVGMGACLATLPWLGVAFMPAGAVITAAIVRWLWRRNRGLVALIGLEVASTSLVVFVEINNKLFDGFTPYSKLRGGAGEATGAHGFGDYAGRSYRLLALLIDRDYGVLRWAPFLALAFVALWLLVRARRERLGRAVSDYADAEAAGALLVAVCGVQLLVAAFLAPTMFGTWFPGRQLIAILPCAAALCGWGLRHFPRAGATLAALTILASVWYSVQLRTDDRAGWLEPAHSSAPFGPAERALPSFR